jgi:hypothetical protein
MSGLMVAGSYLPIEPRPDFRKKLSNLILRNTLGEDTEIACMTLRGMAYLNGVIHKLVKREKYEGAWDNSTQSFSKTKQKYQKSICAKCGKNAGLIVHAIRVFVFVWNV